MRLPRAACVLGGAGLTAAVLALPSAASAAWDTTTSTTAGAEAARIPAGLLPTSSADGTTVTVDWSAVDLAAGVPVRGYRLIRTNALTGDSTTPANGCSGTVTRTGCVETDVPAGSWKYAVRALIGDNWSSAPEYGFATLVETPTPQPASEPRPTLVPPTTTAPPSTPPTTPATEPPSTPPPAPPSPPTPTAPATEPTTPPTVPASEPPTPTVPASEPPTPPASPATEPLPTPPAAPQPAPTTSPSSSAEPRIAPSTDPRVAPDAEPSSEPSATPNADSSATPTPSQVPN